MRYQQRALPRFEQEVLGQVERSLQARPEATELIPGSFPLPARGRCAVSGQ